MIEVSLFAIEVWTSADGRLFASRVVGATCFLSDFGAESVQIIADVAHERFEFSRFRRKDELELRGVQDLEQACTLSGCDIGKLHSMKKETLCRSRPRCLPYVLSAPDHPGLGLEHFGLPVEADLEKDGCTGVEGSGRYQARPRRGDIRHDSVGEGVSLFVDGDRDRAPGHESTRQPSRSVVAVKPYHLSDP